MRFPGTYKKLPKACLNPIDFPCLGYCLTFSSKSKFRDSSIFSKFWGKRGGWISILAANRFLTHFYGNILPCSMFDSNYHF